jgi:hypothetical protein
MSADTIMIGDRVTLTIEVDKGASQKVDFPQFNFGNSNQEESSVEVITDFPVEVLSRIGDRENLRKRYELAIFDEGVYDFGKAKVLHRIDENRADTLYAERDETVVVETVQIDTTHTSVLGLKPQKNLEFCFAEISGYVAIAAVSLLLLAIAIYLLIRYLRKRGKGLSDLFKSTPALPPHIVALTSLEKLRGEKLWQNDKHKLYYSGLSDILRTYLAGRFGVGAMEMTTDEIVDALRGVEMDQKSKMDLLSVLRDADLVKFAKEVPLADENEQAYDKALHFVESTKPIEIVVAKADKPTKNKKGAKR